MYTVNYNKNHAIDTKKSRFMNTELQRERE